MARQNVPFLAWNRGLVSKKALARVDLDRTRLSAEIYRNWLPSAQGAMRLRPGTKWQGSNYNDTGAVQFVEFVASTDDVAVPELTHQKMRIWVPSDTGNTWETPNQRGQLALLARPHVTTTLTLGDTGWFAASSGGGPSISGSSTRTFNAGAVGALARLRK